MSIYKNKLYGLKITIVIILIIVIVFLQACIKQKTKYVLIIDNSVVNSDCVYLDNNCFRLPLICTLKEIGIDICWIDNDIAEFQWNNQLYLLSLREKKLIRKNDEFNLITPPPGSGDYICEVDYSKREIILDDTTLHGVLQLLGFKAYFNIDCENCLFHIEIIR